MAVDKALLNVVQLGLGFMLIFTAFQSCGIVQQTVIKSAIQETKDNGSTLYNTSLGGLEEHSGYYSLAVIYGVFTVGNFVAAPIVQFLGARISMVVGAVAYILYLASFLKVKGYLLYLASALVGMGAPLIWTGQGAYLTANSNPETYSRNSGIIWALLQCSLLFGSLFLFGVFRNKDTISSHTRLIVYAPFTVLAFLGTICLFVLRTPPKKPVEQNSDQKVLDASTEGATVNGVEANSEKESKGDANAFLSNFVRTFTMLGRGYMLLLLIVFFYTGLELSFFSGVYTTVVANTKYFKTDANSLLGLTGTFIGIGEIIGGLSFGILGKRTVKYTRNPVIMLAFILHYVAFFLIFLSLPDEAALRNSDGLGYINPNVYLAIFCGFCLGLADACWNTQVYSILMALHPDESESSCAFALFKFSQSAAAAIAFYYTGFAGLHIQLLVLVIGCFIAAISFFHVEWKVASGEYAAQPHSD